VLFCAASFVPLLGIAAFLFSPTPLALLGVQENKIWMTAGLLGAAIFLLYFMGPWVFSYFLVTQGFLCFGLTLPLGKVKSGGEGLLFCTVTSIVSKIIFMALFVKLTGKHPVMVDVSALRVLLVQTYSGGLGQDVAPLTDLVERTITLISYMTPSFVIFLSMVDSFLNYRLCETLQRRRAVMLPALPPLGTWRFSGSLFWALLCAFILSVVAEEWPLAIMLSLNLKFLVNMFFFLQGISLIWWWLTKRAVHVLLRGLIVSLLCLPVLGMWVIALGVGDICFDFRTKKRK
jgi:uncharacterized protein YybS (DUF2232 family)